MSQYILFYFYIVLFLHVVTVVFLYPGNLFSYLFTFVVLTFDIIDVYCDSQSQLLCHFRYTKKYSRVQKGEFLLDKNVGVVVICKSKQFYPPGGTKNFSQIALEIKNNNSFKNFDAKPEAEKKSNGKKFKQFNYNFKIGFVKFQTDQPALCLHGSSFVNKKG